MKDYDNDGNASETSSNPVASIRDDILRLFPGLFGTKNVNGRKINVEEVIGLLSKELEQLVENALEDRRNALDSKASIEEKGAFPKWDDSFEDAVYGNVLTFREIVQGLIDNFLGRKTSIAWRLNDEVPIPKDSHPLMNPGLELTGPWHPLDMAIKQINADVAATMGPDDEDAAPADYVPYGAPHDQPVGLFVSRMNERRLLAGEINEAMVAKKGQARKYRIEKTQDTWPTSFHRVPGIHLRTDHVTVNRNPALAIIVDYVIHALNDLGSLKKAGRCLYYYQPKIQHPKEALIVAKLVWRLEQLLGAEKPGSLIKFKALYEEGNLGRFLPIVMWIWRHWLIGTNVGRWDYTGSIIEMWKNDRVLPDPQNTALMGMTSSHMMAYQKYNALLNVMSGQKDGQLTNAAPIGGMAAVMLYPATDPYNRGRHNPVTLRAMKIDKLRERLIGLIFVPDEIADVGQITLKNILSGAVKGRLYDAYRQSWVASPDKAYVDAGNGPLRVSLDRLQALLDFPEEWVRFDGNPVAPSVASGLTQDERKLLSGLKLLNESGAITPWVIPKNSIDSPEKFLTSTALWGGKDLWNALYDVPEGEVTIENIQHAFYMAANYGFQVLNGNLAAAIDDYKLVPNRVVRFMNDLATYRIFVGWLWTVAQLEGRLTKDGFLKNPKLTRDGLIPAENSLELKSSSRFTREVLEQLLQAHNQWTRAFFEDFDRLAAIRIICSVVVDKLKSAGLANADREELIDRFVQQLSSLEGTQLSPTEACKRLAILLGINPSAIEEDLKLITMTEEIKSTLSKAFGRAPTYVAELSYEEAASRISQILGIEVATAIAEVNSSAPRFDRSKAPIIMDLLKRQLLSTRYIQHSPRVLFIVAEKDKQERSHILDSIYYLDEHGTPLFRNERGEPSREKLIEAVEKNIVPRYALEAHDYVYDLHE